MVVIVMVLMLEGRSGGGDCDGLGGDDDGSDVGSAWRGGRVVVVVMVV